MRVGIVGNHNHSAKQKNIRSRWKVSQVENKPSAIDLDPVPVQKCFTLPLTETAAPSLDIYPPSGLVCGRASLSLSRIRRAIAMHKILLAEDDNDMRRFLVKALENAGFQVSSHDNGMSAYQRLREEPFEMLLTDIVMPEMDGIELARRASELDPDIKIMFITGFAAVALNSDSEAPKNAKVLAKPVHLRELVSEVNKMLAA
jgi:two-component system cell cycle response regulator CpdR